MNELVHSRFFGLLTEPSQEVTNEEMSNAYGEFMENVKTVGSSDDNATAFRILNCTRIELASLEPFHLYEQGEKCPKINAPTQNYRFS